MIEKNKIYTESCRETLRRMPADFVDCVITSPPYWGLRDYQNPPEVWGGDDDCVHTWADEIIANRTDSRRNSIYWDTGGSPAGNALLEKPSHGSFCQSCGAWYGCLGLEPSPVIFVENLVSIFREIYRVLKPSGTVWLNLGDSYTVKSAGRASEKHNGFHNWKSFRRDRAAVIPCKSKRLPRGKGKWGGGNVFCAELREKNLAGVPWRVALALQNTRWFLRQEIIWHKKNPMPESVQDRCTKAHEHIFLLTKEPRYYFDHEAIAEEKAVSTVSDNLGNGDGERRFPGMNGNGGTNLGGSEGRRNKRSVWEIASQPFPGAHFATFPEALPRTCILAGCPENGIVYDPFMGAGTTGLVARKLQRHFIGSEVNADYCKMARKRVKPYLDQINIYDLIAEAK